MKRVNWMIIGLMVGVLTITIGAAAAAKEGWVPVSGNVTYKGAPVCAMVLINGQYAFTCSGDGSFGMEAPLDANGRITVQAFCSGRSPFKQIVDPSQAAGMAVALADDDGDAALVVSNGLTAKNSSRCIVSGTITYDGTPVCAMVLANGQYQFTCSGDGSYRLDAPLDESGGVTLYAFCAGKQPYKISYASDQISFTADTDQDGYTITAGDCNDLDAGIHPGAHDICGDGIDQDCNGADAACTNQVPVSFVAAGTYSFDGSTAAMYFSSTTFIPMNGPTPFTTLYIPVTSLTATTMTIINEGGDAMTWTRSTGTADNIAGTWTHIEDDGGRLEMQIWSDGTVSLDGHYNLTDVYSGSGTYTYSGNVLRLYWTSSDFDDGPRAGQSLSVQILAVTATTMQLINDEGRVETWERWQGTSGNIAGTWSNDEEDDCVVVVDLKNDGTFTHKEYIE
jgi:hypothetical protein